MAEATRRLGPTRTLGTAATALVGTALMSTVASGWAAYRVLTGQARKARAVIPHRTDNAPDADGVYAPSGAGPLTDRDLAVDLDLIVFGDSTAAGLGAETANETPGAQLARMLADRIGKRIMLSNKAIVGATSRSLAGQVDAVLITRPAPDIAVVLIGANDVTAVHSVGASARRLGLTVKRLVEAGSDVVVGTCPDLGVVTAIPQPLRFVLRQYGLRLAAAQSQQVRRYGGRAVPLADLLADEFLARPDAMFSPDNFHPSAAGYLLAARILLPEVLAALGEWTDGLLLPEPPITSEYLRDGTWARRLRGRFWRAPPPSG